MVASALNAFHNIFLKQVMDDEWSITAYNYPLPRTEQTKVTQHTCTCMLNTCTCIYTCTYNVYVYIYMYIQCVCVHCMCHLCDVEVYSVCVCCVARIVCVCVCVCVIYNFRRTRHSLLHSLDLPSASWDRLVLPS